MYNHRLFLLVLLVAYVFMPTLFNWMISADSGTWFRPYIVWLAIIFVAFALHKFNRSS